MKKFLGLSLALLIVTIASAQIPDAITKAKDGATAVAGSKAASLLTQFANGLKTTSLLSSFAGQKSGWLAKAGKVADGASMASSVASLAGGINPSMFKSGFNVSSLISTASTIKTLAGAGGMLKNLAGGLKPEALTSTFAAQKPSWESALSLLK